MMIWIINIGFLLILTCLTGSICMAVWLAAAFILQKQGNARVIYRLLKLVMWGYTMPLLYLAFLGWNRFMTSEGWVLITTSRMDMILRLCFTLWLIGAAIYAIAQIPMVWQFRNIRKSRYFARVEMTAIMDRLKKELGIRKNIVLYQGYRVVSPFICGFRRTEIYLPAGTLSERELEIVLRHELTHHRQKDTFWKPAFAIINGLFWFNPLVWYASHKMQRWAEASCDESCCKSGISSKEYFDTILDMVTSETWRAGAYSPLWAEGENELMWRIRSIKRGQKHKRKKKSWAAITTAAVMMVGSCISVYAATLGTNGFYNNLFRDTRNQAKESWLLEETVEHTGTADELFEGLTIEEMPDVGSKSVEWTIKDMSVTKTVHFSQKNGDTIQIVGIVKPDNITVQVGIIEPDNHLRYIDAKDFFVHTFELTKTGFYKVYIDNPNSVIATVSGAYD